MMAGGTWNAQNKVLPGVYIRFQSGEGNSVNIGDRGTVAICEPMSWGPVGKVLQISNGQSTFETLGYHLTDPKLRFLNEIFKGSNRSPAPNTVLLYRPSANGAAPAAATAGGIKATAAYPGVRGNDISVAVSQGVDSTEFTVTTVVDGEVMDTQQVTDAASLAANEWVTFSASGTLASAELTPLTGGADGTVQPAAYATFLTNIEPYKFDILIYDGQDTATQTAFQNFVTRMAEENGQYSQLVTANMTKPDSRYVINVTTGVLMEDGTAFTPYQVCWWVGGVEAAARNNMTLTYASYPGAVDVASPLTNEEKIAALNSGSFVLFAEDGAVKVLQDINSLTTWTPDIGKVYRKNRVIRLCNSIANDIYREFSSNYIGVTNNNDAGRMMFKSAVVNYLLTLQGEQAIQNFTADDVEVLPGEDKDAVVVNLAVQAVDSVEKIYMTVTVS